MDKTENKEIKNEVTPDEVIQKANVEDFVNELSEELELPPDTDVPFVPDPEPDNPKEDDIDDLFGEADELNLDDSKKDDDVFNDDEDAAIFEHQTGHMDSARFMLIQMDKMVSFIFHLFSGVGNWDDYRIRKSGSPHGTEEDDYELQALATLIKKYQMTLSVEFIFISAFAMGYTGVATKAFSDRKERINNTKSKKDQDG